MELRDFGTRCGFQIPRASMGGMRFPQDEDKAIELIRHAIDSGMRYIDTSRGYGDSEIKLGKALKDGYREKVLLSTKWAPWCVMIEDDDDASADCVRKRIDESMKRLDVEYLDFYQVWSINTREQYDLAVAKGGMVDGIRKAMDEGLVRHTGFTTHDTVENLLVYLDEADWCEILLLTHNLLNHTYVPVIEAAHKHGIGTIVMNPVGGGKLAEPSTFLTKLAQGVGAKDVPDLAIRYLMSNPNLDTIISGISKPSDVDDSIASVNAEAFTVDELKRIHAYLDLVSPQQTGFCTGCGYCLPCPNGVEIRDIMYAIYDDRYWGFTQAARRRYGNIEGKRADACTKCGVCVPKCTQHLDIPGEMTYALKRLAVATS
jgi:predicted aldo/keto reductase-like oxidoreductase